MFIISTSILGGGLKLSNAVKTSGEYTTNTIRNLVNGWEKETTFLR